MKTIWTVINKTDSFKGKKNSLFIGFMMICGFVFGLLIWFFVGRLVLPGLPWMICFIGYPVMLNLFTATIFLYNHEFDDKK